jgi:metal-responsive CopG/Arc/MetJ family transcriptional regulator
MAKKILSVTIDEKILSNWKKFTDENFINSSKLIEKLIKDYLDKREGNKK